MKKIVEYIELRKILVKKYTKSYFEIGDFAIYKLSEVLNIESLFWSFNKIFYLSDIILFCL